jgi:hypothetical protein
MSEWVSVLAVFWVLWLIDGARLAPRRGFTVVGFGRAARRARAAFSRVSLPGWLPGAWRIQVADVPFAVSPDGLWNRPAGAAGRPAEYPVERRLWAWAEIRQVGVARGWIFINGARFCPDTGHLAAPQILALAALPPAAREARLRTLMAAWFRPAHLRRRVRVLHARTRLAAALNTAAFIAYLAVTIYVGGDIASRLALEWTERLVYTLLAGLAGLAALHVAAIISAARSLRRLKPVAAHKRGANLLSAAVMPPQALRLRALAGEGFFPAQHPVAVAAAVCSPATRDQLAFLALADLRWPIGDGHGEPAPAAAKEIVAWFAAETEHHLSRLLAAAKVGVPGLFAAPMPDAPASCLYCPRCRDQFVAGPASCPHGVALQPVRRL